MLVEADPDFVQANRCLVTPVVVRAAGRATTKVHVFNPYAEPTLLKGELVPVGVKQVLRDAEHPDEKGNQSCMRKVQVKGRTTHQAKRVIRQAHKVQQANLQGMGDAVPSHIEDLIERSLEGWSAKEQAAIKKLLTQYQDVFSKNEFDLGKTHLVEHTIDTGDAKPIAQPPRRVPLAFAEAERKQIGKMLETGVVQPSTSPWASPVCLVRKPDGSARVCIDFRGLNTVTTPIQQPIPRADDCLDSLAGGKIFSVGDGTSAYWQIAMRKEDIPKTAFTSRYGLLEFLQMPMGLKSAGATFQRLMEIALAGLQWVTCLIYLDDVIVFGKDFDEHLCRLAEVLL